MEKRYGMMFVVGLVIHGFAGGAYALAINNASFENGMNGWAIDTPSGSTGSASSVVSATAHSGAVYNPQNGSFMAAVNATSYISQAISWKAGQTLSFDWAFLGRDNLGQNDYAIYSIKDGNGNTFEGSRLANAVNKKNSLAFYSVGTYGDTGWQQFDIVFDRDGSGIFQLGAVNGPSGKNNSTLLVDNVRATPIPGAALLFGSSLLGLLGINRRKNKA